ncbi:hypothetical protein [Pyrobaculum sp.]|uniref:hypothetical protein n=1 Tax=Pyrobaculum sp. TaxID=2004705 RepID=UPI003D0F4E33
MFGAVIRELVQVVEVDTLPMYLATVWLYALTNDGHNTPLVNYIDTRMIACRLLELLRVVDYVVQRCNLREVNEKILENIGREMRFRVKRCPNCTAEERYAESDFEILLEILPASLLMQKA